MGRLQAVGIFLKLIKQLTISLIALCFKSRKTALFLELITRFFQQADLKMVRHRSRVKTLDIRISSKLTA